MLFEYNFEELFLNEIMIEENKEEEINKKEEVEEREEEVVEEKENIEKEKFHIKRKLNLEEIGETEEQEQEEGDEDLEEEEEEQQQEEEGGEVEEISSNINIMGKQSQQYYQHYLQQYQQEQQLQQQRVRIKRPYSRKNKNYDYKASHLINDIISDFQTDELLVRAAKQLGEHLFLQESDDAMRFIYCFQSRNESTLSLHLTVIKGSIFTVLWSTIARFDDEYLVEIVGIENAEPIFLWTVKGYHSQSNSIDSSDVNWNIMKTLQNFLEINYIGLHSFAKLLSRVIIGLPIHEKEGMRYDPMPITYI